ncbi:DUF892 family protein [Candidatus Saccharibacteria bacterium]|nr:DUF892 family protein [Candidatus Saccharibacteria bacterium]
MAQLTDSITGFNLEIKTLYDIEKQLEKALPRMAEAAINPELSEGFMEHLEETKEHANRLEKIFKLIGVPAQAHPSQSIKGLIADGDEIAASNGPEELRDALLAGAARGVEHFEMACYMNAIETAKQLELSEAVELLEDTLGEEEAADEKLKAAVIDNLQLATV